MSDRTSQPVPDISDATWAHNRWPVVGLYTGAGIGLALGVVFVAGWLWTILYIAGLAVLGCLVGFGLAMLIYDRRGGADRDLPGGDLEPAGKDENRHTADEDAAGGDDHAGGVAGAEDETQHHGQ